MNKLCVMARNRETYFMRRLTEEVGDVKYWNPWESSEIPGSENILVRTSGVYGDDRDLVFLKSCSSKNIINPVSAHEILRDKSAQFSYLERRGFHLIPWRTLNERGEYLPEKILIKPIRGQGGWGIRVMTQNEFLIWEKETTDRSWIIQPFLENVREYRLFFCGEEELLLERSGGVAANFTQGGKAKLIPIPAALSELGDEVRHLLDLSYGAIDLFEVNGEHLILEINPVPGVEQLEQVTGQNIVRKVISLFRS